tara:strand:- start:284 stop:697 length:414 start_codon:yes stop_codon:yes gene_type:complete
MIYEIAKEKQLFDFLKKNYIPDLEKTTLNTSRYDCYSNKHKLDIELKCRRKHYDDLILEKKKYAALMSRCNMFQTIPVYVNSTPQGVWAYYIAEIEMKWEMKRLPNQTDFTKNYFIQKEITYLNISKGVNLTKLLLL